MSLTIPEATPPFSLISATGSPAADSSLKFPIFVKPVKSWFSQYARAVNDVEQLDGYLADRDLQLHLTEFTKPFNQLLRRYPDLSVSASQVIGEALLVGLQVTVEGYVLDKLVGVIGIVDSIMYPSTTSFAQFVYPVEPGPRHHQHDGRHRCSRRERARLALDSFQRGVDLRLDVWSDSRPRGESSDVRSVRRLDGSGQRCKHLRDPVRSRAWARPISTHRVWFGAVAAASFPRRHFGEGLVRSAPSQRTVARVQRETSATLIAIYYEPGQRLSASPKHADGFSYRYATINIAADRSALVSLADQVEARLGFDIG